MYLQREYILEGESNIAKSVEFYFVARMKSRRG